jgi:CheY-like chemotaxis protein
MFPEFHPTIVLLDLHMPGMSGFQVAEQLAGKPQREEFQLVALTGYGQDEDRRRTREAGFDHHLTKPVDPQRLATLLEAGTGE